MHAADPTQQGVFARGSRGAVRPLRLVAPLPPLQAPKLLDQVRERVRYLQYSQRTARCARRWTDWT